ncbi:outer membrane protein assembly factor BamD [Algihabitans albus]|uniref:outer membrane protein assembly factor BamD n=1 Tax=Algihabitans albus TaxID=2164067 RepID=UPI000E5D45B6|nr:outer membrane protein assembly factor BamD [Algihabitans albus]
MAYYTRPFPRAISAAALASLTLLLAGCGTGDEELAYEEQPVEELYNRGYTNLLEGENDLASQLFDEVERQHPYSVWAPKAQLMAAYAHYQDNRYDDAINTLDRFIELNPGNEDVGYAYYLKAISYYEQISDVGRDQRMTELALGALEDVTRRFPESEYARDSQLKIDLARDHLAGKHMTIGRYYLRQGEYLASINRFRIVIEDYQTTAHTAEALHRLVEAYMALGVTSEAQATAAVLGYNYPGSDWYIDSYALLTGADLRPEEDRGSWISRIF